MKGIPQNSVRRRKHSPVERPFKACGAVCDAGSLDHLQTGLASIRAWRETLGPRYRWSFTFQ